MSASPRARELTGALTLLTPPHFSRQVALTSPLCAFSLAAIRPSVPACGAARARGWLRRSGVVRVVARGHPKAIGPGLTSTHPDLNPP